MPPSMMTSMDSLMTHKSVLDECQISKLQDIRFDKIRKIQADGNGAAQREEESDDDVRRYVLDTE